MNGLGEEFTELICPVCSANQPVNDTCRRCRADLQSVVAIKRQVALVAIGTIMNTISGDYQRAVRYHNHLSWLDPKVSRQLYFCKL